jgi:uncharacterized integral membrane protein
MVVLLFVVGAAALVLFAYQNPGPITVHFGYWSWSDVPGWYPAVAAALGVLIVCALRGVGTRLRWRRERRALRDAAVTQEEVLAEHDAAIDDLRWKTHWLEKHLPHRSEPAHRG